MLQKLLIGAALVALTTTPAFAQSTPHLRDGQDLSVANFRAAAGDAPTDQNLSPDSSIELNTDQNETRASLRLSLRGPPAPEGLAAYSLTLSTPLDKDDDNTTIANLRGLSGGTTLAFAMDRMHANRVSLNVAALEQLCARAAARAAEAVNQDNCDDDEYNRANLSHADYVQWRNMTRGFSSIWFWGLHASGGDNEFTYYDATDLSKHTTEESEWSAGAYVALSLPEWRSLISLSVDAVNEFEPGRTQTLCPGGAPPLTCVNGPIGAPEETERRTASLGFRHDFGEHAAGIAATLSYDFENDVYAADLPVYFIRNEDHELTGGLRLGWQSDDHEVTVGVIVSKAFDFATRP